MLIVIVILLSSTTISYCDKSAELNLSTIFPTIERQTKLCIVVGVHFIVKIIIFVQTLIVAKAGVAFLRYVYISTKWYIFICLFVNLPWLVQRFVMLCHIQILIDDLERISNFMSKFSKWCVAIFCSLKYQIIYQSNRWVVMFEKISQYTLCI